MDTLIKLKTRREVRATPAPGGWSEELIWYGRAVRELQSRPLDDPTSWEFLAAVHGTFRVPGTPVQREAWSQCQHATWYFLPWHRMYVYLFEKTVREAIVKLGGPEDWALPYWRYEPSSVTSRILPRPFGQPTWTFRDATGTTEPNPLYTRFRNPGLNEGERALAKEATSHEDAFQHTSFSGTVTLDHGFGGGESTPWHTGTRFTGAVERQPHNLVHVQIGGTAVSSTECSDAWMSKVRCAALDPIFWLHHANVDRLWTRWLALGGGRANPDATQWRDQEFVFYDGNQRRTMTPKSVESTEALGYQYDDHVPAAVGRRRSGAGNGAPRSGAARPEPEVIAAAPQGVELTGRPVDVPVALTTPAAEAIRESVRDLVGPQPRAEAGGPSVYLALEGLRAPAVPGVIYQVFIDVPGDVSRERQEEYAVGSFSFFGMEAAPGSHAEQPHATGYIFDITGLVAQLVEEGRWRDDEVTVTIRPVGLERVEGPETATPAAPEQPHAPVRIGRVTILRG